MAPKSGAIRDVIKNGDLIWVVYRKTPWPAKAKNVYPKKISYHFFPITEKPQTFSADPKVVSLFKEDDKLEEPCPADLKAAFRAAKKTLRGEVDDSAGDFPTEKEEEEKVIKKKKSNVSTSSNNSLSKQKKHAKEAVKAKTSIKSNDNTRETKPQKVKQEKKKEAEKNLEADAEMESALKLNTKPDFKEGDVVIVGSDMGMWPAKFVSYDAKNVICQLFPLEDNEEYVQSSFESVFEFAHETLDKIISDTTESNPKLASAFECVKIYLQTRAKEQKKKEKDKINIVKKSLKEKEEEEKKKEKVEVKSRKRQREGEVEKASATTEKKISLENSSATLRESPRKKKKPDEPKKVKKAITFCERITSYEAQQFIKEIFSKHSNYKLPESADLYFDFRNGGLLTFDEAELVIATILTEYSLCTKLPPMLHLCKMHYISAIVFPNLCIFGLSKLYSCTLEEAKQKYEHLLISEIERLKTPQTSNGSENGTAFENLVTAAVLLKGAEEKKNGGNKFSKTNGLVNGVI